MTAKILDGKWLAACELLRVKREAETITKKRGFPPGLAVILVGDNPASKVYVAHKEKAAKNSGFDTFNTTLPESATKLQVIESIEFYNQNPKVDGILLQLPIPKHLDSSELINCISPTKDVDGLHPLNQGKMIAGLPSTRPCTPLGVIKLIDLALSKIQSEKSPRILDLPESDLSGKTAIVIGRSILVGKPVSILLLERNATVTMAHSRSPGLDKLCAQADIVIAAAGRPEIVVEGWIKSGAIVIDVGINRVGSTLTGDVDFEPVSRIAGAITPVPGGVGPMTVAILLKNTISSAL